MKTIDTYVKEAFITKSNIKRVAKSQEPSTAKELMDKLFSDVSPDNANYLEEILRDANLMPEGNLLANPNIYKSSIKWIVSMVNSQSGWCYAVQMCCDTRVKISTRQQNGNWLSIPICRILKDKVIAPDSHVEEVVRSYICTRPTKDILEDIVFIAEDIADYLGIDVFDARHTLCIK